MIQVVATPKAPKALGPYSQAIVANGLVFTSGQIAIDPKTGSLIDGSIEEQTKQVLDNLSNVLESVGGSLQRALKTTVFLQDMADFSAMNKVYSEYFPDDHKPARSTVQVAKLPLNAKIEIELVALA
jgi:2-iminobutanoate/2-iminopropanoate deaminase